MRAPQVCFDLWGDTVNVAARMEQGGQTGAVHVSDATRRLLSRQVVGGADAVATLVAERESEVKGRGPMRSYLLAPADAARAEDLHKHIARGVGSDDKFHEMFVQGQTHTALTVGGGGTFTPTPRAAQGVGT